MPELTPAQKSLLGRALINRRWAMIPKPERTAATQAARDARWRKYLDRVDPERVLPEAEREALAAQLRRSDMQLAAMKSARSRQAKAARKRAQ